MERKLPPGYVFQVNHYHPHNDPKGIDRKHIRDNMVRYVNGKVPAYSTEARIVCTATGEEIAYGVAVCSPTEQPCRRIGYEVATGRAYKQFYLNRSMSHV